MVEETKDKNYQVGYGKPPQHTRFQKGRSGNPKGRPRGSRNAAVLLKKVLNAKVVVRENGRPKTITMLEAVLTRVVHEGARGNYRATKLLIDLLPWLRTDLA